MNARVPNDVSTFGSQDGGPATLTPPLLALTIVAHPDARRAGERLVLDALAQGREVALSRNAPDFVRPGAALGAPLADPFLSRTPLLIAPGARGGLRLGAPAGGRVSVAGAPLAGPREVGPDALAAGVAIELGGRVVLLLHWLGPGPAAVDDLGLIGASAGVDDVRRGIERVAGLLVPVLVRGETGTGKELIARAVHERSPRRGGRFVSVNLGAVPRELAAAELFGAQRGAFTGANRDREGFFAAAQGGTLFLDEVGEAPPEVQAMLLRVLETGEFYPVGASAPRATDARIVAATDAHLEAQIRDGRFKAPLLHRLAGYEIRVPALRERRDDIGPLFYHFARGQLEELGEAHRLEAVDPRAAPWLPAALATLLVGFDWPGNVRQLRNVVRQLVIDGRGQLALRLDPRLARELGAGAPAATAVAPAPGAPPAARRRPADVAPAELAEALRESAWDMQAAADRLGITRPSLYHLVGKTPIARTAGELGAEEITRAYRECGGDLDALARRLEVSKRALARRVKELGLGPAGA